MRNKELFRGRRKAGRIVGLVLTLALAVSLLSGCGQSKERLTFGTGGNHYQIQLAMFPFPQEFFEHIPY